MKLHLAVAVWGRDYTKLFTDYCLPSLMAPGNIPSVSGRVVLDIYTTPADKGVIQSSPVWKLVSQHAECRFTDLKFGSIDTHGLRYSIITHCHKEAYKRGHQDGAAVGIICPDNVYGDGYVNKLVGYLDAGKRLVLQLGMRAAYESLAPQLGGDVGSPLSISNRDLVRLGLHHLHPLSWACLWGNPFFSQIPYIMHWSVEGQGLLTRSFVMTPALVVPSERTVNFTATCDFDIEAHVDATEDEKVFVDDSDDLMTCELNFLRNFWPPHQPYTSTACRVVEWAKTQCFTELNWKYLERPIRWRFADVPYDPWGPEGWFHAESKSGAIVGMMDEFRRSAA